MKIIQDTKHSNMYRLQWPDGRISHDMYNKTRAKELIKMEDVKILKDGETVYHTFGTAENWLYKAEDSSLRGFHKKAATLLANNP